MIDISVIKVKKAFEEGKDILNGLSFEINEGEHVALLGKNGAGKTTLFRLLAGEIEEDEGEIVIAEHKKLGLISQIPRYPFGYTVEDVLKTAFLRLDTISKQLKELEDQMRTDGSAQTLKVYDSLVHEYERSGGYETEYELRRVANGLEIPAEQLGQKFDTLSGGEKTRVNLARLILENTDILLLDEPTNHLDMRAAEWLEDYIVKYKGTVLIISHDRYFLDRTVTRSIEILDGKAEHYGGNYSFYVAEKARRYEETLLRYEREQSEARRLQTAADRLHQWGTGNKNLVKKSFAIEKRIERLTVTDRPRREKRMGARFDEKEFRADNVMTIKDLSKGFDGKVLFCDIELEVGKKERIAIIGDNGSGKSTLINIIAGLEKPDTGKVKLGPAVKLAYLPQIVKFNNPRRSLIDTLVYEENITPGEARNRLGAFNFKGDDVFKHVSDLSGGEQSRLRLCLLMNETINLLILDEPTNHLDIDSREWIESAVSEYEQALLFVSHDRYFVEKFATRIWEISGGQLIDFKGSFSQYRTMRQNTRTSRVPNPVTKKKPVRQNKKPSAVAKQLSKLEREIQALESVLDNIVASREEYASDYEKLLELDETERVVMDDFTEKYLEWETLTSEASDLQEV